MKNKNTPVVISAEEFLKQVENPSVKKKLNPQIIQIFGTLKVIRKSQGLTLKQLADKVDMDQAHLSRIENNYKNVELPTLFKIAEALGVGVTLKFKHKGLDHEVNIF